MQTNYIIAGWCYIISALLDAIDGHAARAFNQSKYARHTNQLTLNRPNPICINQIKHYIYFGDGEQLQFSSNKTKPYKCTHFAHFPGTKFGSMLDQLTDRCGTMGLLVTLSYFYPRYMFWFQISMVIDIACHWIYLQA